jgi:hypothetical protein
MAKRVKEAFSFDDNGVPVVMRAGTLVEDDDPRIKGRERHFEDADDAAARTSVAAVETATAAPGERRTVVKQQSSKTR